MLSKSQIVNFFKLRRSDEPLNNIKNIIIIAMIKYYKDMDIIALVDNIILKKSKRKSKVLTSEKNGKYTIYINENLSTLNKIEYILNEINYIYNNKTYEKTALKEIISLLQTEDIMKLLFKIVRLNNIEEFEKLSIIDNKTYKCYIKQVETNLFRPIYNNYKKNNKELVKNGKDLINRINEDVDHNYISSINKLYEESSENSNDLLLVSENYRKIKDITNIMLKILNNN